MYDFGLEGFFNAIWILFLIGLLSIAILTLTTCTNFEKGYKQGQIDALNGEVKYRQVEKKDWERIDN